MEVTNTATAGARAAYHVRYCAAALAVLFTAAFLAHRYGAPINGGIHDSLGCELHKKDTFCKILASTLSRVS